MFNQQCWDTTEIERETKLEKPVCWYDYSRLNLNFLIIKHFISCYFNNYCMRTSLEVKWLMFDIIKFMSMLVAKFINSACKLASQLASFDWSDAYALISCSLDV